jgi:ribosomal protein S12 methylthiotransferase accessory factor
MRRECALDSLPDVSRDDFYDEVAPASRPWMSGASPTTPSTSPIPSLKVPAVYGIMPGAHFAERTINTDAIFHAAKLASQLPDPDKASQVLDQMGLVAAGTYYLPFFKALALINLRSGPKRRLPPLMRRSA